MKTRSVEWYRNEILRCLKKGSMCTSWILDEIGWDKKRASKNFMIAIRGLDGEKKIQGRPMKEYNWSVLWWIVK